MKNFFMWFWEVTQGDDWVQTNELNTVVVTDDLDKSNLSSMVREKAWLEFVQERRNKKHIN